MDKIWDRKSFEVGGHWPLWRGWKKRMTMQNRQKSNAKKILKKLQTELYHVSCVNNQQEEHDKQNFIMGVVYIINKKSTIFNLLLSLHSCTQMLHVL